MLANPLCLSPSIDSCKTVQVGEGEIRLWNLFSNGLKLSSGPDNSLFNSSFLTADWESLLILSDDIYVEEGTDQQSYFYLISCFVGKLNKEKDRGKYRQNTYSYSSYSHVRTYARTSFFRCWKLGYISISSWVGPGRTGLLSLSLSLSLPLFIACHHFHLLHYSREISSDVDYL